MFSTSIHLVLDRTLRHIHNKRELGVPVGSFATYLLFGDFLALCLTSVATCLRVILGCANLTRWFTLGEFGIQILVSGAFGLGLTILGADRWRNPDFEIVRPITWEKDIRTVGCLSALIQFRLLFKILETGSAFGGFLSNHEWAFYLYDSLLMLIIMLIFLARFPSHSVLIVTRNGIMVTLEKEQ